MTDKGIICFLNPSESILSKIQNFLSGDDFIENKEKENEWKYEKGEKSVEVKFCLDASRKPYIKIWGEGVDNRKIWKLLSKCPECGSNKLRPSIHCIPKNELIYELLDEDLIDIGYGAYDRLGTFPETRRCYSCGCKWYSNADLVCWQDLVANRKLTRKDLGAE